MNKYNDLKFIFYFGSVFFDHLVTTMFVVILLNSDWSMWYGEFRSFSQSNIWNLCCGCLLSGAITTLIFLVIRNYVRSASFLYYS